MPSPGIGLGPEPMDWQRQGISTLDLRSRPPRQREFAQRSRDRTGSSFAHGGAARSPNPQQWQAAAGNMVLFTRDTPFGWHNYHMHQLNGQIFLRLS